MLKKIMLFPIRITFMLVGILMDLFIKAECWVGGIAFMILPSFFPLRKKSRKRKRKNQRKIKRIKERYTSIN